MSEAVSALGGQHWTGGIAEVREIGPVGMITLRGDLSAAALKKAVKGAVSLDMPAQRGVTAADDRAVCWMSPDEVLILCDYDAVQDVLAKTVKGLGKTHGLAVDVSDARAVFRVSGPHARDVMAKLAPVDLSQNAFAPGELRRTRLAQVAAAFRMVDEVTFEIICFRSVAQYVFDLLKIAAQEGSEVGFFAVEG